MIDPFCDAEAARRLAQLHGALADLYHAVADAAAVRGHSIEVACVRVTPATPDLALRGLIGWVSCVLAGVIRLDGIAVRRTSDGRLVVSYPTRRDSRGVQHPIVLPLGEDAELEIERQILKALDLDAEAGG